MRSAKAKLSAFVGKFEVLLFIGVGGHSAAVKNDTITAAASQDTTDLN